MARTAIEVKCERNKKTAARRKALGLKVKFPTRVYNRCRLCGKVKGYMRKFETCRICFKELAHSGSIMGITKSSW